MNYQEKYEYLIRLLMQAEALVSEFRGGYSSHFFSAEEFHQALTDSIKRLKQNEYEELDTIYLWFAPTYDWDDFTNVDGILLGNQIFELVSDLVKNR